MPGTKGTASRVQKQTGDEGFGVSLNLPLLNLIPPRLIGNMHPQQMSLIGLIKRPLQAQETLQILSEIMIASKSLLE